MIPDSKTLDQLIDEILFGDIEETNKRLEPYFLTAIAKDGGEVQLFSIFGGTPVITIYPKVAETETQASDTVEPFSVDSENEECITTDPILSEQPDELDAAADKMRCGNKSSFRNIAKEGDESAPAFIQPYSPRAAETIANNGGWTTDLRDCYKEEYGFEYKDKGKKVEPVKPGDKVDSTSDQRTVNNVMRHAYRVLTDEEKKNMQKIKDMGLEFWNLLDSLGSSRELSLAKTKVEEAVMWGVKDLTK